jgi:hypothetical protein
MIDRAFLGVGYLDMGERTRLYAGVALVLRPPTAAAD